MNCSDLEVSIIALTHRFEYGIKNLMRVEIAVLAKHLMSKRGILTFDYHGNKF